MWRFVVVVLLLAGCSSVRPITDQPWVIEYEDNCTVTVYQTREQALKDGDIVEMCFIDGTSSMSWKHTPEVAIEKHAKKACRCDSNKVFVQSRSPNVMGVASVSMVAFEWETD